MGIGHVAVTPAILALGVTGTILLSQKLRQSLIARPAAHTQANRRR
jgi:hypothetical protein